MFIWTYFRNFVHLHHICNHFFFFHLLFLTLQNMKTKKIIANLTNKTDPNPALWAIFYRVSPTHYRPLCIFLGYVCMCVCVSSSTRKDQYQTAHKSSWRAQPFLLLPLLGGGSMHISSQIYNIYNMAHWTIPPFVRVSPTHTYTHTQSNTHIFLRNVGEQQRGSICTRRRKKKSSLKHHI